MTLTEALLFEALTFANQGQHADTWDSNQRIYSYNRCLEEVVLDANGNPARALRLGWGAGDRRLRVDSDARATDSFGSRFAAVSADLSADLSAEASAKAGASAKAEASAQAGVSH